MTCTTIRCGLCQAECRLFTGTPDEVAESAHALKIGVSDRKGMSIEFHCPSCKGVVVLPRFLDGSEGTFISTYENRNYKREGNNEAVS